MRVYIYNADTAAATVSLSLAKWNLFQVLTANDIARAYLHSRGKFRADYAPNRRNTRSLSDLLLEELCLSAARAFFARTVYSKLLSEKFEWNTPKFAVGIYIGYLICYGVYIETGRPRPRLVELYCCYATIWHWYSFSMLQEYACSIYTCWLLILEISLLNGSWKRTFN